MALMGLKYMAWAPIKEETASAVPTYDKTKKIVVGKMVSLNVKVNNAEGELYADDALAEYAGEFSSADLTAEVDNISLENQATMLGAQYEEENGFAASANDTAPYGGVGGYQVLQVSGAKKYRSWFYPKTKAVMTDVDASTRQKDISFGTQPITMKVTSPLYGPWYCMKEFDAETDAKKWVDTMLGDAGE